VPIQKKNKSNRMGKINNKQKYRMDVQSTNSRHGNGIPWGSRTT
jgi:hypothetical protein